jgi:pimeloyl-ACP methyl ester carboxylesterase
MKRKYFSLLILLIFVFAHPLPAQDAADNKYVIGSWIGKLSAGGASLRVVFNLSVTGNDSLVATLDSPDQGAKNIKLGLVTLNGYDIKISAPLMLGEYNGTIKNDTIIEGTWTQRGSEGPLNLTKLKGSFAFFRPQEPQPPFPYASEDVVFTNEKAGIILAGTLTLPAGIGPFPAVILITGSGAQNRNEELLGHKPFLVIADYLTRKGIAVLRYDDRGVGKSQGSMLNSTSADFAGDAQAAFQYLRQRKEINPNSVGFAGHSEGGLVAPIVASANKDVAFVISLAGMAVPGEKITDSQLLTLGRLSGIDEKELKKSVADNRKILNVLIKESDNKKAEAQMTELYRKMLVKQKTSPGEIEENLQRFRLANNPSTYTWTRYYLSTDPADFWKKVKCPVLALNGEKDTQVNADENLGAIQKSLQSAGNKSFKTIKFHDLNHLFQHCKTGLPTEYADIEETFSQEVLMIMADWIHQL